MIDVRELRIGNIVYIEMPMLPTWQYHYIKGQDISDIENGAIGKIGVINIHPVPLTPELLEKCGFVRNVFNSYNMRISGFSCGFNQLSFSGDYLYIRQGKKDIPTHEDDICVLWNKDIMKEFYLHQLQNLIYILSGNELNVEI